MGAQIPEVVQKVQLGAARTVSAAGRTGAGWGALAHPRHPAPGAGCWRDGAELPGEIGLGWVSRSLVEADSGVGVGDLLN